MVSVRVCCCSSLDRTHKTAGVSDPSTLTSAKTSHRFAVCPIPKKCPEHTLFPVR